MPERFFPGEDVVFQDVYGGRVWSARPMRVVRDDGDFVALWAPKGSIRKIPTSPPTRERLPTRAERFAESLTLRDWIHIDNEWDIDTLWLMRAGEWHATEVSWIDGEFWGWYINLQDPFRRTPIGFQTMDLELDILIARDGTWRFKDEDEFEHLVAQGLISEERAAQARRQAERVVENAARGEPPFNEPWGEWRPDPDWPLPALRDGWDQVF